MPYEKVTREMIGAGHDVLLKRGIVLSYEIMTEIYKAMSQAAPPEKTPFDTCPTCEALARTVLMDQTGEAKMTSGGTIECTVKKESK